MAKKKVTNRLQQIGGPQSRSTPPPMPGRDSETQLVEIGMFVSVTMFGSLIIAVLAVIFARIFPQAQTLFGNLRQVAEITAPYKAYCELLAALRSVACAQI